MSDITIKVTQEEFNEFEAALFKLNEFYGYLVAAKQDKKYIPKRQQNSIDLFEIYLKEIVGQL